MDIPLLNYKSRQQLTTQRAFNDLKISGNVIEKTGKPNEKIQAEASWYENIPPSLRLYTPAYLGRTTSKEGTSYYLSYEYLPPLSDLFVFGRLSKLSWNQIFIACSDFLDECVRYAAPQSIGEEIPHLYNEKPRTRVDQFCREKNLDPDENWIIDGQPTPSLNEAIDRLCDILDRSGRCIPGIMHGDFCFSNILYDTRKRAIKVVDPRGHISGYIPSLYGDLRYDVAKLAHSVVARYDFIVSGCFSITRDGPYSISLDMPDTLEALMVEELFLEREFVGCSPKDVSIRAATALLFLSMLPLHGDNPQKQLAFIATGLNICRSIDGAR